MKKAKLICSVYRELQGHPEEFRAAICSLMDTDYLASRMLHYLQNAHPRSAEEIADEAVSLLEERDRLVKKHISHWKNGRNPVKDLYLKGLTIDWDYPFRDSWLRSIPALSHVNRLTFTKNLTFFVGENGSGKSTLLEALAVCSGLNGEGGTQNYSFSTFDDVSDLGAAIQLVKGVNRPKFSYFLRAESFFNVASVTHEQYNDGRMPDYHARSHGESFLDFIQRYDSPGLYLMDEPEAALSPQRQLTLLIHLIRMARAGSQFLISTHSPILLGAPGSEILSFDSEGIHPILWEDTDSYRITKMFLQNRDGFLRRLLADDDPPGDD